MWRTDCVCWLIHISNFQQAQCRQGKKRMQGGKKGEKEQPETTSCHGVIEAGLGK